MADNLTTQGATPATPSAGTIFRTRDIGGAHVVIGLEYRGTGSSDGTVSVATTDTSILAAGTTRLAVHLTNKGAFAVWVGAVTAVAGEGAYLPPGAVYIFDKAPNAAFRGIAVGGTSAVAYYVESET